MHDDRSGGDFGVATATAALAAIDRTVAHNEATATLAAVLAQFELPEQEWLGLAQSLTLRGNNALAAQVLQQALMAWPDSAQLAYAYAGALLQQGDQAAVEHRLAALLRRQPQHLGAGFLLARLYREQGRMQALEQVMLALFDDPLAAPEDLLRALELLDDCGRKTAAAALCEHAIAAGATDPRLFVFAGLLQIQLGDFALARERYLFVLRHSTRALEWQVPLALANTQRYQTRNDPDFALFADCLAQTRDDDGTRAAVLFAQAKAFDDVGALSEAAQGWRRANAIVQQRQPWSRKHWRRAIEARLGSRPEPAAPPPDADFVPLFIVGAPRSGTTLVAELLSRHTDVCNRGELAWLPHVAQRLAAAARPDAPLRRQLAETYLRQLRQDDSAARWMIDKQPLNVLHLGLVATLFPNARVIHCRRSSRDTALSIWAQYFAGRENDFAYDFADIAAVLQGAGRLMAHWRKNLPLDIREVSYEQLARDPHGTIGALADWLELDANPATVAPLAGGAIGTSSLWQVRQPVYTRSIGRWQAYAPFIPELTRLFSE